MKTAVVVLALIAGSFTQAAAQKLPHASKSFRRAVNA